MKNRTLWISLLLAIFFIGGCGTMNYPKGSTFPGLIYTDAENYPSYRETPLVRYDFKANDVVVLGPVMAKGLSTNILMVYSTGDNGFGTLMNEVKKRYPDADGVINVNWDTTYTRIGFFYLSLFEKIDSTVYGLAIKTKR